MKEKRQLEMLVGKFLLKEVHVPRMQMEPVGKARLPQTLFTKIFWIKLVVEMVNETSP